MSPWKSDSGETARTLDRKEGYNNCPPGSLFPPSKPSNRANNRCKGLRRQRHLASNLHTTFHAAELLHAAERGCLATSYKQGATGNQHGIKNVLCHADCGIATCNETGVCMYVYTYLLGDWSGGREEKSRLVQAQVRLHLREHQLRNNVEVRCLPCVNPSAKKGERESALDR